MLYFFVDFCDKITFVELKAKGERIYKCEQSNRLF